MCYLRRCFLLMPFLCLIEILDCDSKKNVDSDEYKNKRINSNEISSRAISFKSTYTCIIQTNLKQAKENEFPPKYQYQF